MTSDWRRWQHALIARHAFGLFASVAWAFAAEGFDLLRWQPSVLAALASVAMGFDVVVARAVTRIARAGPPLGIARAATFAAWAQVAFGAVAAVLLVVEQLGIASPSAYLREAEGFVFVAAAVTGVDLVRSRAPLWTERFASLRLTVLICAGVRLLDMLSNAFAMDWPCLGTSATLWTVLWLAVLLGHVARASESADG